MLAFKLVRTFKNYIEEIDAPLAELLSSSSLSFYLIVKWCITSSTWIRPLSTLSSLTYWLRRWDSISASFISARFACR